MEYDIGILTFWDVPNYGTFAQAYALQKTVQHRFPNRDCRQIAYLNRRHYDAYYSKKPNISPLHRAFYLELLNRGNPKSAYNRKQKMFLENYNLIPHTEKLDYKSLRDIRFNNIILGSDIIWDFSFEMFDNDPFLFGVGFNSKRISSYAASFGTIKDTASCPAYVVDGLNKMEVISVRDEMSAKIAKSVTGRKADIVLDPTYLWDFSKDSNVVEPPQNNYMIIYGQDFNERQISEIIEYAHSNQLYLICLDCNNDNYKWCDLVLRQYELTPFQWIGYFKYATTIATTTFHGLTFSLIFNKPFAFCKTDFIMDKAGSYLKEIGLYNLFNDDNASIDSMINNDWDYDAINKKIEIMREQSFKILDKMI